MKSSFQLHISKTFKFYLLKKVVLSISCATLNSPTLSHSCYALISLETP
jgi:hypothetical protein